MKRNPMATSAVVVAVFAVVVFFIGSGQTAFAKAQKKFPVTLTDALGRRVTIAKAPKRVVSLSPAITETVWMLGAGKAMVGRTDFCNYPPDALKLKSIGGIINPSLEAIALLSPDLVLVQRGSPKDIVDGLADMGIIVFALDEPDSLEGVLRMIDTIGVVIGRENAARGFTAAKRRELDSYELRRSTRRWRVYFGGIDPPFYTAGAGTFINDLIVSAGGENIAAVAQASANSPRWFTLSPEEILLKDPEVILIAHASDSGAPRSYDDLLLAARKSDVFGPVSAAKNGRICVIDEDELMRPGPRVFDALREFADYLSSLGAG